MCAYLRVCGLMGGAFVASLAGAPSGASRPSIHQTSWNKNSTKFGWRITHDTYLSGEEVVVEQDAAVAAKTQPKQHE